MKQTVQIPGVDDRAFRCCLCCHVKTGTLFYGVLMALGHLIVLGLLIFAAVHPDVLMPQGSPGYDGIVVKMENGNMFDSLNDFLASEQINKHNLCFAFGISLVCLMATLALIYGIARNLANYLVPFFCLQVFDFCLSCLAVIGCFTYRQGLQSLDNYPVVDRYTNLNSSYQMLLIVTLLVLILSVKAYLIGMVWSCYKYIQLHVASRSIVREYNVDPDSHVLLPPCYDDAVKHPGNFPQPPAYQE